MNFLIRAFLYTLHMHAFSVPDLYWPIILASIKILSFLYLDSSSITFVLYSSSRDSTSCSLLLSNALSFSYMNVSTEVPRISQYAWQNAVKSKGCMSQAFHTGQRLRQPLIFEIGNVKLLRLYRSWFKQEISFRIFNKYSASTTSKLAPIYKLKRWITP